MSLQDDIMPVLMYFCVSSLVSNRIGEAGARELFTALQFNKTLAELK
jgi:hypothetical protein